MFYLPEHQPLGTPVALVVNFPLPTPTTAIVEHFFDIHLWLFLIAKNIIGQPRVGPPVLAVHMRCGAVDMGPRVP